MKNIVLIAILTLCSTAFGQQLPQFSQYGRNQFMVNPGAAGMYDFVDITLGGRYQWVGFNNAPMTAYAYGAGVLKKSNQKYNPSVRTSAGPIQYPKVNTGKLKHAIAGQVIADEYGAFRRLSFAGTYAIHLPVTKEHNLSFGTKIGLSNNSFLQERAVLLSSTPGYTGPIMQDEVYDNFVANQSNVNILDIGAGLYFYSEDMFLGVAADGLTRDMVQFGSGTANFDPRIHLNITGGYKFPLNDNLTLMPTVLAKMVAGTPLAIEGSLQFEYQEWLWFGSFLPS